MNPKLPIESGHNIEPWQLTAYALGELDAIDAQSVESALEQTPELRAEYEQIQQTIGAVRTVLSSAKPNVALAANQSELIAQSIAASAEKTVRLAETPFYRRKRFAALLATAAMIPVAFTFVPPLYKEIAFQEGNVVSSDNSKQPLRYNSAELEKRIAELQASGAEQKAKQQEVLAELEAELQAISTELKDATSRLSKTVPLTASRSQPVDVAAGITELANETKSEVSASEASRPATVQGTTLPSADYLSDDVQYFPAPSKELADTYSTKTPSPSPVALGESNEGYDARSVAPSPYFSDIKAVDSISNTDGTPSSGGSRLGVGLGGGRVSKKSASGMGGLGGPVPSDGKPSVALSAAAVPPAAYGGGMPGGGGMGGMGGRGGMGMGMGGENGGYPAAPGRFSVGGTVNSDFGVAELSESEARHSKQLPEELRQNVPDYFYRRENSLETVTGDRFEPIVETPFVTADQTPLSTFSIDVDTASYSKIRQYLTQSNVLPNPNMVRIEEMINYFEYEYAGPKDDRPFAAHMAIDRCPWNLEHQLVRIGLQARKVEKQERPKANIVFLLDVSGSMNQPNKLPLVKKSLSMLAGQLTENDKVAIVVYAGAAGCVLPSTCGAEHQAILSSLDHLNAGGSTNGGQGIQLAYSIAKENFIPGGVNRVILCTDGDFNVGVTGDSALVEMMQQNAKSNIFLTCLGFGMGNYNDTMMEKISNQGNGIYGMIDNEIEARRMMVEQLSGTLVTVAKDVKIQVDFNPNKVAAYRLIGYEDRRLANKDFDNDQKDAGEIGAGHRVTALYEVIPVGKPITVEPSNESETSKYQNKPKAEPKPAASTSEELSSELLTLKIRYKEPEGSVSTKQEFVLKDLGRDERPEADRDMQWASCVAEFGLLLRHSRMAPQADWTRMIERAERCTQGDAYRLECVQMMRTAAGLSRR